MRHTSHDPQTEPKKRPRWKTPALTGGALILGIALGAAGGDTDTTTAEATTTPSPAPTVTETATPEPAPTVTETPEPETITETVEVQVASDACLTAIESGEEVIDLLSQGMDHAADGFHAASLLDADGLDTATKGMEALHGPLGDAGFDWGFWVEACKDGS